MTLVAALSVLCIFLYGMGFGLAWLTVVLSARIHGGGWDRAWLVTALIVSTLWPFVVAIYAVVPGRWLDAASSAGGAE